MKTRKQWIAMILMLAMLFTALPMTAFAEQEVPAEPDTEMQEPETQIENDTESLPEELEESEPKPMQPLGEPQQETIKIPLYLHYPETTAEGRTLPYGDWLREGKQNFSADTVAKAEAFWKNLKQHCKFYVRKDGKITPWEPTIWEEHASGSYFYYVDVPKDVEYVFLEVDGQELPAEFSMGDYSVRNKHWYYCEPSDNQPDFDIYVYQVNLVFDPNGGQYPGDSVTPYTTTINNKNQIKYPDAPTREGYLFKDWVVPIYATKDLTLGGGTATSDDISPDKGAETSEHVAILEHGNTNGKFGWTFNHFWWIYERDKPKLNNTRTFYARWERPELVFYNKSRSDNPTDADIQQTNRVCNGKSIAQIDWDAPENKDLLTPPENKITDVPKLAANTAGEEFDHWIYVDKQGKEQKFDKTTVIDEDKLENGKMKLYPVFAGKGVVKYDPNGGEWVEGGKAIKSETYKIGIIIKIAAAPTREGYLFKHWKGSEYQPGQEYKVEDKEHTFTAIWERPTLTFYGKEKDKATTEDILQPSYDVYAGKSLEQSKKDQDWTKDGNTDLTDLSNFELPKADAPEGMEFKGWVYYDENDGKQTFDMNTTVNGDMKLYPVFEKSATPDPGTDQPGKPDEPDKPVTPDKPGTDQPGTEKPDTPQTPEKPNKPSVPSDDSKIKTPRGSALTAEEIAKILAGSKKVVPAIPRAGVGR